MLKTDKIVLGLMSLVMLLASCSGSDERQADEQKASVINIYIYAPEQPVPTRADNGDVAPLNNDEDESTVKNMQIWVFNHETADTVAYHRFDTSSDLSFQRDGYTVCQLTVSDDFEKAHPKPNVDVYVVANVTGSNFGLSVDKNSTRDQLDAATIGNNWFGLNSLTYKVPTDGLPESGVLKNQPVSDSNPVFRIGDDELASVKLARMVSKVRYVFSREGDESTVKVAIKRVTLAGNLIPQEEFLFLNGPYDRSNCRIGSSYVTTETTMVEGLDDIAWNDDPLQYTYQAGQGAQEYENLIDTGVANGELTQRGPYYLKESDRQLTGTITYQLGTEPERTVSYKMAAAGDFSRNHSWIVYVYYGASKLEVSTVAVRNWGVESTSSRDIYNW